MTDVSMRSDRELTDHELELVAAGWTPGSVARGAVEGAAAGAAIGRGVGGGVGAVVGGAIGAVVGAVSQLLK